MTSEGLGEMFEGDSADMCAGKFPLVSMGGRAEGSRAQTREQGPPSALAEIINSLKSECLAVGCTDIYYILTNIQSRNNCMLGSKTRSNGKNYLSFIPKRATDMKWWISY